MVDLLDQSMSERHGPRCYIITGKHHVTSCDPSVMCNVYIGTQSITMRLR